MIFNIQDLFLLETRIERVKGTLRNRFFTVTLIRGWGREIRALTRAHSKNDWEAVDVNALHQFRLHFLDDGAEVVVEFDGSRLSLGTGIDS